MNDAVGDLRDTTTSNGAPSARNLLVTVFGDAILPHGAVTAVSVGSLAALLEPFGVNERLVRTSLSRLVNEGLLTTRTAGRRSFYSVDPESIPLFRQADARIYGSRASHWDGSWTIVVIDAAEGDAEARARLRQRLTWAGLGVIAPNVMASPVVAADDAARAVAEAGVGNVFVGSSQMVGGTGTIDEHELARRCVPLDDLAAKYAAFVDQFAGFDRDSMAGLSPAEAFKLRTLLVATYRRIVLVDPLVPESLLPDGWAGSTARALAASVYSGCADAAERHLAATTELPDGSLVPDSDWLHGRFVVE